MKLLLINSVCGIQSTGRIVASIAKEYKDKGYECAIAYGRDYIPQDFELPTYRITSEIGAYKNIIKARVLDNDGFSAQKETKQFIKWAEQFNPDVVWLHNLHGYYINIEVLFQWLKSRPKTKVYWTLHDCWAFTGHCSHFSYVMCDKWKQGCQNCVQKTQYPSSWLLDNSKANYEKKKRIFTGVSDLTIVTPSKWLSELVKKSYLNGYPIEVQNNKIDKSVFKPTPSDFREKYRLEDKKIVLGVSNVWHERKGLYDFFELSRILDERFAIVLVGLTSKQIRTLPRKIKGIETITDVNDIVKLYSAADVFVNPSKEETFSLTTAEAQACGTPTIVYKGTACEEILDKKNGMAVENDVMSLKGAILDMVGGVKIYLLERTESIFELAQVYSAADVFLNLSYEETYPTVNLEATFCGLPVVTYRSGGSTELALEENVVERGHINEIKGRLIKILF